MPSKEYAEALRTIKEETGLFIVVHTGSVDANIAERLRESIVDCVSIDIIGDDDTIR